MAVTNPTATAPGSPVKKAVQTTGKLGVLDVVGVAVDILDPLFTYRQYKKEGKTDAEATTMAAVQFIGWQVAAPIMWGSLAIEVGKPLAQAAGMALRNNRAYVSKAYEANFGGNYIDSQQAYTMRSAGIANISRSRASLEGSLGNEAKSYYRRQAW